MSLDGGVLTEFFFFLYWVPSRCCDCDRVFPFLLVFYFFIECIYILMGRFCAGSEASAFDAASAFDRRFTTPPPAEEETPARRWPLADGRGARSDGVAASPGSTSRKLLGHALWCHVESLKAVECWRVAVASSRFPPIWPFTQGTIVESKAPHSAYPTEADGP